MIVKNSDRNYLDYSASVDDRYFFGKFLYRVVVTL